MFKWLSTHIASGWDVFFCVLLVFVLLGFGAQSVRELFTSTAELRYEAEIERLLLARVMIYNDCINESDKAGISRELRRLQCEAVMKEKVPLPDSFQWRDEDVRPILRFGENKREIPQPKGKP